MKKKFDHVITKSHPMAELFEKTFFKIPEKRGIHSSSYCFYIREHKLDCILDMVYSKVGMIDEWDEDGKELKKSILKRIDEFNSLSKDYKVYIGSFCDSDFDDDRYWDATYSIGIAPLDEFAFVMKNRKI